ncbi:MAG: SulP family inorganic anion transporter [Flavobacteriales bacterium]|nr:SulP family inorganic anion transporter [Flavobacteriales bacterium]
MFKNFKENIKSDFPSSIIVFLVALPLCLGIASASKVPILSGLIAGIVGGIVVTFFSRSELGVSGPAAGLIAIVIAAVAKMGFNQFLVAVMLSGVIQFILGVFRAGIIGYYFPNSVIRGMLSGIGIVIIIKEIPHALGYDKVPEGEFQFSQSDGENSFSELFFNMFDYISIGAIIITLVGIGILLLWNRPMFKKQTVFQWIQGPLVAVISGILLNNLFQLDAFKSMSLSLSGEHLVQIPPILTADKLSDVISFPDFNALFNVQTYITAAILALVASLETLLCVEATDKLDPEKRITPTSIELKAQGIGNVVSGLCGGLPVTQVIVRSSANIQSGAKSRLSAFIHGFLLLICAITIPFILNMIPLASLAAILLMVGYKLANPQIFKEMWNKGLGQFVPYIITIIVIVRVDLLWGIGVGLVVAILNVLYDNMKAPYFFDKKNYKPGDTINIELSEQITFLNKGSILQTLQSIPDNSKVIVDASRTVKIHPDVLEIFDDFKEHARSANIDVTFVAMPKKKFQNQSYKFSDDKDSDTAAA